MSTSLVGSRCSSWHAHWHFRTRCSRIKGRRSIDLVSGQSKWLPKPLLVHFLHLLVRAFTVKYELRKWLQNRLQIGSTSLTRKSIAYGSRHCSKQLAYMTHVNKQLTHDIAYLVHKDVRSPIQRGDKAPSFGHVEPLALALAKIWAKKCPLK